MDFLWPVLEDIESVKDALRYAAVISGVLCGYNLIFLALSPIVVAVCVVYAVAAWRIWKGSQGWAFAAFVMLCVQIPFGIFIVLLLFAFVGLMNGVRAAIAFERLQLQAEMAAISETQAS